MSTSSASAFGAENAYAWGPALSVAVIFVANLITYALNPNSRLYKHVLRRCGVPRMFFVSNRADYVDRRAVPKTYWAFDLLEPAHVVQSYILSTPLLLVLHLFTFLYFVVTVIVDVVVDYYLLEGNRGPYGGWVTFLTNWSITLLGFAGLVAFIDTARHIHRERHARKCLKAAQQQQQQQHDGLQQQQPGAQRSSLSQMGNLEATSVIAAWRDYEHASRTNSLLNLSSPNSPQGTRRTLGGSVTPGVSNAYTSPSPTSLNPHSPQSTRGVMLSPSPTRMITPINPNSPGAQSTKHCITGGSGLSEGGGVTDHRNPTDAGLPLQQQQQGVELVYRHPHSHQNGLPAHFRPAAAAAAAAAAPAGESAVVEPTVEKKHPPAADEDVRDASGSSSSSSNSADTVVVVQEGEYSRRPTIKGIDQWDWLSGAHCILMEIATTAAFFVSFWYWVGIVGIANSGFALSAGTYMAHAGNVAIALLQIVLTRQPVVSVHFQVLLWYATLYEIFVWIYGEVSGIWRYSLDWQVSKPAGAFALIPAITFIMFGIWYLAAILRERAFIPVTTKVVQHHRNKHQHHGDHDEHGDGHHVEDVHTVNDGLHVADAA